MSTETLSESVAAPAAAQPAPPSWPLAQRIAFRFCTIYFTLYCLAAQIANSIVPLPNIDTPDWGTLKPFRLPVEWTAKHIFRVQSELVWSGSGSGDKTFDWVQAFCILVVALVATAIWSVLDRRRQSYPILAKWFRLFLRVCLASQMVVYAFAKVPPLQMPFPYLSKLLEPFGQMSPMGVLWSSIGASPAYEIFAGCAELTGGLLLIFPRTVTFGALVCLADLVEIFLLNMTYDVPVKQFSFHLILLSLLLLAPDAQRLANLFFLNRTAEPRRDAPLFRGKRARRIAQVVLAAMWLWMLGANVYGAWTGWHEYGGGAPKAELYGIWNVQQYKIDGVERAPLVGDASRPRRLIFDFPKYLTVTQMDDTSVFYGAALDMQKKTLALTKPQDKAWKADLTFNRTASDQLAIEGQMDGHKVGIQLRRVDEKKMLLLSRGFHWIQEYPFNR